MRWYHYVAYFFGGAFLANALPHLGNGISGHAFQSPFASPPGEGLSSSTVNVLWGLFNLAVGYLLVIRVGSFDIRKTRFVLVLGAGVVVMSVMCARGFGRFHGGLRLVPAPHGLHLLPSELLRSFDSDDEVLRVTETTRRDPDVFLVLQNDAMSGVALDLLYDIVIRHSKRK